MSDIAEARKPAEPELCRIKGESGERAWMEGYIGSQGCREPERLR